MHLPITLSLICLVMIKKFKSWNMKEIWKLCQRFLRRMAKLKGFFNKSCENSWKTFICYGLWFQKWMVWRGKEKNVHEETVFVSSNDIACSWFFNLTKPNVGTMVFNYRNRIQELTDNFAGNYVTQVKYQTPDYKTP